MTSLSECKLLVILGATASGKSALALDIAKKFNGEIVAADSRTVYKGMDIGTAKPSAQEQRIVSHHLLDEVEPDEPFNVVDFQKRARLAISDIAKRGKLPILVGGTGLYVDSILYDFKFMDASAERDEINPRHLKRDRPMPINQPVRPNTLVLGMDVAKELLEDRINDRVDQMIKTGLEQEVKALQDNFGWDSPAMTGVGYAEWQAYFAGLQDLEKTKALIKVHTRQYAKRQRTWFKRNKDIIWVQKPVEAQKIVTSFLHQNK